MASLFELFETDEDLEVTGVQLDYDGTYITIARAGGANTKFEKVFAEIARKHKFKISNDLMTSDEQLRIMAEVYADTVVLGWGSDEFGKGKIKGPDGKPLEFTRDNVVAVLTHPKLRGLFADLREQAGKVAIFRKSLLEDAEKN